jgi:glycosyltransferase involved in cell wall biosynthesis
MTEPISLSDSDLDRESVAAQFVNNRDLQERIRDADILLLPFVAPLGETRKVFTNEVRDLFRFLNSKATSLKVEVATDSDSPPELVQHGVLIDVGVLLVTQLALPIVAALLGNYIWKRLEDRSADPDNSRVRCRIHVITASGTGRLIEFDGPASAFGKLVEMSDRLDVEARPKTSELE